MESWRKPSQFRSFVANFYPRWIYSSSHTQKQMIRRYSSTSEALMTSEIKETASNLLVGNENIGVLLFNLGGPESLEDVQPFLFNLFADPDCLEVLSNLIRSNASNQILLKETIGFEPLISILKIHRGSAYNFTQQKTINLLRALETVDLLLLGGPECESTKGTNRLSNQTAFAQKNLLDHLLTLGAESQWAPITVRCRALRCIGNLVLRNPQNRDAFASKLVGEAQHAEAALNAILRIILRTSITQEFIAVGHVFK